MPNYNSAYTGAEIDAAVGAVQTAVAADGIVNTNGLDTILGNYLTSSSAANTYLTKNDAANTYLTSSNAANTYLTQSSAADTYAPLTGTGTSGTWPISITGNADTATYATKGTYLYADNSPYRYGDNSPYYAHMTYHTNGDYRWYLRVYPETPKEIAVDYAYNAGSANSAAYIPNKATVSGSSHAAALKSYFASYKSSIPKNALNVYYSSAYGNGSLCFGYWLPGYDSTPYGGFFVCHYNDARYIGISNGTYTEYLISKSATSALRTKENIRIFNDNEAKKILQLNPIIFDYKKEYGGEKNQYGLIAEDVEKIIPYAVYTPNYNPETEEKPIQSISYEKFIPYLIKLAQIQNQEIENLKSRIDSLENK